MEFFQSPCGARPRYPRPPQTATWIAECWQSPGLPFLILDQKLQGLPHAPRKGPGELLTKVRATYPRSLRKLLRDASFIQAAVQSIDDVRVLQAFLR